MLSLVPCSESFCCWASPTVTGQSPPGCGPFCLHFCACEQVLGREAPYFQDSYSLSENIHANNRSLQMSAFRLRYNPVFSGWKRMFWLLWTETAIMFWFWMIFSRMWTRHLKSFPKFWTIIYQVVGKVRCKPLHYFGCKLILCPHVHSGKLLFSIHVYSNKL